MSFPKSKPPHNIRVLHGWLRDYARQNGIPEDASSTPDRARQSDPSFSTVTRIAKALGITRADLMRRVERKRPQDHPPASGAVDSSLAGWLVVGQRCLVEHC